MRQRIIILDSQGHPTSTDKTDYTKPSVCQINLVGCNLMVSAAGGTLRRYASLTPLWMYYVFWSDDKASLNVTPV